MEPNATKRYYMIKKVAKGQMHILLTILGPIALFFCFMQFLVCTCLLEQIYTSLGMFVKILFTLITAKNVVELWNGNWL